MWLLEDSDMGKIIGHHDLLPIKFSYFGRPILTRKTENTVMHPQYRGKGIYYPFEVKFCDEAKERFQLLYTTWTVAEHGRIRPKLGYAIVGCYASYVKATKNRYSDKYLANIIKERIRNRFINILDGVVSKSKEGGIHVIQFPTLSSDNFLNKALRRNGPMSSSML
jgi:hypothetical protein